MNQRTKALLNIVSKTPQWKVEQLVREAEEEARWKVLNQHKEALTKEKNNKKL